MQPGLGIADQHLSLDQGPEGAVFVEDLASGLGTCVNGHPVSRAPLKDGDLVRFGQVELRFQRTDPAPPAPPQGFESAAGPPTSSVQVLPEADRLFPQPSEADKQALTNESDAGGERGPALPSEPASESPVVADESAESTGAEPESERSTSTLGPSPAVKGRPGNLAARLRSAPSQDQAWKKARTRERSSNDKVALVRRKGAIWLMLVGGLGMAMLAFGYIQWRVIESEETPSVVIMPAYMAPAPPPTTNSTNLMLGTARLLAGLTDPVGVVSVDMHAIRSKGHLGALPRLRTWCYRHLKMDLEDIKHLVAISGSSQEHALGVVLSKPLDAQAMKEAAAAEDLSFKTLQGDLVARLVAPYLIVVTQPGRLPSKGQEVQAGELPAQLDRLLHQASGKLISYFDGDLADPGSPPSILPEPDRRLAGKTVVVDLDLDRFAIDVRYSEPNLARNYARGFHQAIKPALLNLTDSKHHPLLDNAVRSVSATADSHQARIGWGFKEHQLPILRALIEMVADPLGAEVAPPPAVVLKEEAERLSALYHTALQAMASIEHEPTVDGALDALSRGLVGTAAEWEGRVFRSRPYSAREREIMRPFLAYEDGRLHFLKDALPDGEAIEGTDPESVDPNANQLVSNEVLRRQYKREASSFAKDFNQARASGKPNMQDVPDMDAAIKQMISERLGDAVSLTDQDIEALKYFLELKGGELVLAEMEYE